MKKKCMFIICLMLAACYLLPAQTGTILELFGEVELKPAGSSAFTPARQGSAVAQNTIVSTGFRSTAVIEIGNTTITVRPFTRLSLADIQRTAAEETLKVNLQTGRIRVDVKPSAGIRANTMIQTPIATSSVRGTSFEVDVMNLTVIEGKVIFQSNNGNTVSVSAGSSSIVNTEDSPLSPIELAEAELMPAAPIGIDITGDMAHSGTITADLEIGISGWE